MPAATRALTRAVRDRAKALGVPYTEAREQLLWIQALLDEGSCETFEEADAYVLDPRNQTMCKNCLWTYGMICPECTKGCGCEYACTGWRHREFIGAGVDDDIDPADRYAECEECGGEFDVETGYGCACKGA